MSAVECFKVANEMIAKLEDGIEVTASEVRVLESGIASASQKYNLGGVEGQLKDRLELIQMKTGLWN